MADKVGAFNRLGVGGSGATTATSELEFLEGTQLGLAENFIDTNALRGSLSHSSERVRRGTRQANGTLVLAPNAAELAVLLPYILGTDVATTTYALSDTTRDFTLFPVRDGTIYTTSGVVVETATFSATEGGPMQLSMSVVGKDEAATGSMGSAAVNVATGPFTLMDAVVSVGGSSREVSGFELTVAHTLEVKYRNSLTPTQIKWIDRTVTLRLPISLGTDSALWGSALAGVAASVTLTNGGVELAFTMTKVQAPKTPLPLGQRGILDFEWAGVARKDGSTLELVTTLDSTP